MNKKIVFLFLIFNFSSCVKETVINVPIGTDRPPLLESEAGGTESVGGGNGIDHKFWETYRVDIKKTEPFEIKIKPLIKIISKKYPNLAADFLHIIDSRQWFFVPTTIDNISSGFIGVYGRNDQFALQDHNKIWVNNLLYDKMLIEDKSVLIIHEIIMGIAILKFKSAQDLCIAQAYRHLIGVEELSTDESTSRYEQFNSEKRYCRRTYPLSTFNDKRFSFRNNDYDLIRDIVYKIKKINDLTPNNYFLELQSLIEDNHFRKY